MTKATRRADDLFRETDDAWSAELHAQFGRDAGDARYTPKGKGAPGSKLRKLHDAQDAARLLYEFAHGSLQRSDFCEAGCVCQKDYGQVRCAKLLPGIEEWMSEERIDVLDGAGMVSLVNRLWLELCVLRTAAVSAAVPEALEEADPPAWKRRPF